MKPSPGPFDPQTDTATPRLARLLGVAVVLVAALAWWAGRADPVVPVEDAPAYRSPLGPPPELPAAAIAAGPVVATVSRAEPAPACTQAVLELLLEGQLKSVCVGALRAFQNGSLRTYRANAAGAGGHWLRIDTAGGELVGVAIGRGAADDYACEAPDCAGVSLGAADLRGERTLAFDAVRLSRRGEASALVDAHTLLSGRLVGRAPAEPLAADACGTLGVVINTSGSLTSQAFCALEGVAVEHTDDAGRIHRFESLDAEPIAVTTGPAGELLRIEHGRLSCSGAQCSGAVLAAAATDAPLALTLNGTVLTASGGAWASLNGRLAGP